MRAKDLEVGREYAIRQGRGSTFRAVLLDAEPVYFNRFGNLGLSYSAADFFGVWRKRVGSSQRVVMAVERPRERWEGDHPDTRRVAEPTQVLPYAARLGEIREPWEDYVERKAVEDAESKERAQRWAEERRLRDERGRAEDEDRKLEVWAWDLETKDVRRRNLEVLDAELAPRLAVLGARVHVNRWSGRADMVSVDLGTLRRLVEPTTSPARPCDCPHHAEEERSG